ncbi:MAG: DoxX family protein [Terriglobales bacterium]
MHPKSGWILSGLFAVFFCFDAFGKLALMAAVVTASVQMGIPADVLRAVGASLLVATIVFLIPRTLLIGSILITAYMGGAVFASLRAHAGPGFIAGPIIAAVLVWIATLLRDRRYRALLAG